MSESKAQIFTTDFFMALFIFSILIAVIMVSWNNYNSKVYESTEYSSMMGKIFQISNVMVKSTGYPSNWTSENVRIIGLASSDRNLSAGKVDSFVNLSINKTEDIFQVHDFNFYFALRDLGGQLLREYGNNPTDAKKSASIRRYVLYNNEESVVEFTLWR